MESTEASNKSKKEETLVDGYVMMMMMIMCVLNSRHEKRVNDDNIKEGFLDTNPTKASIIAAVLAIYAFLFY